MNTDADIIIAGGGLAGALIAWRLRLRRPDVRVLVVEQGAALGGNHTWSFHETDLTAELCEWLSPVVAHRWDGQEVRFPEHRRELPTPYLSITSSRLAEVLTPILSDGLLLDTPIRAVSAGKIDLENGKSLKAGGVIDCRGAKPSPHIKLGFQKFVGQVRRFETLHGVERPIIMDATVAQRDGYRFLYVLPFDARTLLIEDTRYADGALLDEDDLNRDIEAYINTQGWGASSHTHTEQGILPIALAGDFERFWPIDDPVPRAGMAAALFHPLTGYSLPLAARLADLIANAPDLSGSALVQLTRDHAASEWQKGRFYRLLCRMLFHAAKPEERYRVLQRFYKLPQGLIERFYAGRSTKADCARILIGKPPVPITKAINCLSETRCLQDTQQEYSNG